jgi:RND family efflux transporter MFP subunit
MNFMIKVKLYISAHKIISTIILIIILFIGYWGYNKIASTTGETQYITTTVQKGTIVSSITASGQIESSNQVNLTPKVSGTVTYVKVKAGDKVVKGETLFSIDNTTAQKSVRDAEISLQNANLALQKLQLQNSNTNLNATLSKAYDDGFSTVSNTFLNLPGIMSGLNDMFFKGTISTNGQWNIDWYEGQVSSGDGDSVKVFKQNFVDSYNLALKSYNANFDNYKSVSRSSDSATLEKLITQTYDAVKLISSAIKNANNYVYFVNASIQKVNNTPPSIITANLATLNTYTSQANTALQNLLSIESQIQSSKDSFTSSDLSTQSAEISIKQAQNSLQDAKDTLANYYVTAPFNGTIANITAEVGSTASGTMGSIITNKKIATLSMNEVDVAKIKLGEKATITFDAISDLTMTGTVAEIDTVGTVSSGVVTYTTKIAFDTENDLVKPGMSVSAAIITDSKTDALIIPSSAIKTQGTTKYVQMFSTPLATPATGSRGTPSKIAPNKVTVEVGISDDTNTEIISGLKEGDQIVSSTITSTTKTTTTTKSATSLLTGGRGGPGM